MKADFSFACENHKYKRINPCLRQAHYLLFLTMPLFLTIIPYTKYG